MTPLLTDTYKDSADRKPQGKENSAGSIKFFTSKCVVLCEFNDELSANFLPHNSHPNLFGPCTFLKWSFTIPGVAKRLKQCSH